MVSTMYIGGVETVDPRIMSFQVVTSGASTFTIQDLTIDTGKTEIVDWGDGSRSSYTGAGSRSHAYAGAGTWTVRFNYPDAILVLDVRDSKAHFTFTEINKLTGILSIILLSCHVNGDSSDISGLNPLYISLNALASDSIITFDSADVSTWNPTNGFLLYNLPVSCSIVINSSDLASWTPDQFLLGLCPGLSGVFNSSNIASWTPSYFKFDTLPVAFTGTFNSSNLTGWSPSVFGLISVPGMTGTFNSTNIT